MPNLSTLGLIIVGFAVSYRAGGVSKLSGSLLAAAMGYGVLWVAAALYQRVRGKPGLGLGDAKLFAAAGAWLGPLYLAPTMAAASAAALGYVAIRARTRGHQTINDKVPFGPFIAGAFFALWCFKLSAVCE